jgi:hypothetical protein
VAGINAVQAVEGGSARVNDICREDAFRSICELITFRQNLFHVVVACQATGTDPDGDGPEEAPVLAEERATGVIMRDSYTGTSSVYSISYHVRTDLHYVATNGANEWPFAGWPHAATNISDAVHTGGDGDTVLVSNGTYRITSEITLTNAVTVKSGGCPGSKVVDGAGAARCFFLAHSNAVVDGLTVTGGTATDGGGMFMMGGGAARNCIVRGNFASSGHGGGIYCDGGGLVENCTIVSNRAILTGGGIYCNNGGTILNSVIVSNAADVDAANWDNSGVGMEYSYCCTTPDPGGFTSVTDDPVFKDAGAGDYRLAEGSPCIEAGWNRGWMSTAVDAEGKSRILDMKVDMGACEFIRPSADTDGDTLPDWWEWEYAKSLTNMEFGLDDDHDRLINAYEFLCGTDPADIGSSFRMDMPSREETGDGLIIRWSSVLGKHYKVMRGSSWQSNFDHEVSAGVSAVPPVNVHTDTTATGMGPYFYRVQLEP